MRLFIYIAILSALLLTAGCVPQPDSKTHTNSAGSPSPVSSPSPLTTDSVAVKRITLPVLDAFFADNSFGETLKTRLKLNEEEVTKLKELARSETAKLDESELEKRDGSVRAHADAQEQIKAVIGEEKSGQLAALVNELRSEARRAG